MMIICALPTEDIRNRDEKLEKLIEKMSEGDSSAIGEFYDMINTDVFAYAISKIGKKADAEDITHDTFVQIYRYSTQYVAKGKPMAWIFTIEINLIRRYFQLNKRSVTYDDAIEVEDDGNEFADNVVDNLFLREILSKLDEDEREIITLHIVWGMKHKDIAKQLNKPLSTVLSRYNRAIKKLQAVVKEGD